MQKTIGVKILVNNQLMQVIYIQQGSSVKDTQRITAIQDAQYQFIDEAQKNAPNQIKAKRVGKDLWIELFDSDDSPELIIDNYFEVSGVRVTGLAEDGLIYDYVPQSRLDSDVVKNLLDGTEATQTLKHPFPEFVVWALPLALAGVMLGPRLGDENQSNVGLPVVAIKPSTPSIESILDDHQYYLGNIFKGGLTNDQQPTIIGWSDADTKVNVYDNGQLIGSTTADATGRWEFTPSVALLDGQHLFEVSAMDLAGNTSQKSLAYDFVVDSTPPEIPTITMVEDDVLPTQENVLASGLTNDSQLLLRGRGELGSKVSVLVDGQLLGHADVDQFGNWQFQFISSLAEGLRSFTVFETDLAGNRSSLSSPYLITIDETAPDQPVITSPLLGIRVLDDVADKVGAISKGSYTNDAFLKIVGSNGSVVSGETVSIYVDGVKIGSVLADPLGAWDFTPSAGFIEGVHAIELTSTDLAGNVSAKSDVFKFTVDLTPPTVSITNLFDHQGVISEVLNGGVTDDASVEIAGVGESGRRVLIYDNDVYLSSVVVKNDGTWKYSNAQKYEDGLHRISVLSYDLAGNQSLPDSTSIFEFTVDTSAVQLSLDQVIDDVGVNVGALSHGDITDDVTPTFMGKAQAGNLVFIYDTVGGAMNLLGSVTADVNGQWVFTPDTMAPLSTGAHSIVVQSTSTLNGLETSNPFDFTIDIPVVPELTLVLDQDTGVSISDGITAISKVNIIGLDLNKTWEYAVDGGEWLTGQGTSIDLSTTTHVYAVRQMDTGAVSAEYTFTLDTVANDPHFVLSTDTGISTVDGLTRVAEVTVSNLESGAVWEYSVDTGAWTLGQGNTFNLVDGTHTYTVRQKDIAGNISGALIKKVYILDQLPPNQMSVQLRSDTGMLNTDFVTNDAVVEVVGVEQNATWQYSVDGGPWVVGAGNSFVLSSGLHRYAVMQIDAAGNNSDIFYQELELDMTVPKPVMSLLNDTGISNTDGVTSVSTVNVINLEPNAQWAYQVDYGAWIAGQGTKFDLTSGSHTYVVRQIDLAGNVAVSAPSTFVYDLTPVQLGASTPEYLVNTTTVGDQVDVSVAALVSGGFIATWTGVDSGATLGVLGQLYDENYRKVGAEFIVNTYQVSSQYMSATASLADGGFVVTWASLNQDLNGNGVYGQRFNSDGTMRGGEFKVSTYTSGSQDSPSVVGLSDGSFVVVWQSNLQDTSGYGIYQQRFGVSGTPIGTELRVNQTTADQQKISNVTSLLDGGYLIAWESNLQDTSGYGVYAQRYSDTGAKVGLEFRVNTTTANAQRMPVVASLEDGGFVIAWSSTNQDGSNTGIYAQRYDGNSQAVGGEFQVNTYTSNAQDIPAIASLHGGGFVVVWQSNAQDLSGYGVYAQRFDANGQAAGTEFRVNGLYSQNQFEVSVSGLANGGFVIAWESYLQDGDLGGIYQKVFDPRGVAFIQTKPEDAPTDIFASVAIDQGGSLSGAIISIGNYHIGEDILLFKGKTFSEISSTYGIAVDFDSAVGKMTLNGDATVANYNAVLSLLQYDNLKESSSALGGEHAISIVLKDLSDISSTSEAAIVKVQPSAVVFAVLDTQQSWPVIHHVADSATIVTGSDATYDICELDGENLTLNLGQMSSVEMCDLTGVGSNKLLVRLDDLININLNNHVLSAGQFFKVVGDQGDSVDLISSVGETWSKSGTIVDADEFYNVYHSTSARDGSAVDIWVRNQVAVNII